MRFGDKLAQHGDVFADKVRLLRRSIGYLECRLAREHQHTESSCVVGHLYVGVDAVADHRHLVGRKAVAAENSREHIRVGFAERDVRRAARGLGQAGAYRAAIDQYDLLVGRAHASPPAMMPRTS